MAAGLLVFLLAATFLTVPVLAQAPGHDPLAEVAEQGEPRQEAAAQEAPPAAPVANLQDAPEAEDAGIPVPQEAAAPDATDATV